MWVVCGGSKVVHELIDAVLGGPTRLDGAILGGGQGTGVEVEADLRSHDVKEPLWLMTSRPAAQAAAGRPSVMRCGVPADSITSWISSQYAVSASQWGDDRGGGLRSGSWTTTFPPGAQQLCDPAEGMGGVWLVNQKAACESEIKPASGQSLDGAGVHVARKYLGVVKAECDDRTRHPQAWLAEVDADHVTVRSDDLCKHRERADRPTAAVDRNPTVLGADSAKCGAGGVPADLRDSQEPTEVLHAAIQDVALDALADHC